MTSALISKTHTPKSLARHRVFTGVVIALSAFAAQAAGPATMTLQMQAAKDFFRENCFTLEREQQLVYTVSTAHPIEFNLHHHPASGETLFPDRLTVKSQHSKRIVAESSGAYCFMATNPVDQPAAFDVVIKYQITKP